MKRVMCDGCGHAEKTSVGGAEFVIRPADSTYTEVIDLCQKCLAGFRKWFAQQLNTKE
ncbi:hypothetical protein CL96_gp068 [Mycobacterium phage Firecracker]|uniref:Uncharacterized protein n=1 Tax=Mycobacterium phage Firecracker TaxID=2922998 RepID=G8I450_9CAUD|nr:hypothetical protein CL96_gp068 [Mycobacterium phage Firecracker]AER47494.1 hypothetical protein FIRECRACKER_68 [Mycobacterium phage Firecracker]